MQYVSQSCAESKQMSALRSLKLCNILPTANRKSLCKVPLTKTVSVGADFAGRFFSHANLDQSANRFNFPAVPRWAPQGNQNHIGFCRGCHCSTCHAAGRAPLPRGIRKPTPKTALLLQYVGESRKVKSQWSKNRHSVTGKDVSLTQMSRRIANKTQSIATKRSVRELLVQKVSSVEPA